MAGGTIHNNIGEGVFDTSYKETAIYPGKLSMQGGEIYGNSDSGVYLLGGDVMFTHTGGTIYGSDAKDKTKRNTATSGKGAAIYWDNGPRWRNETVSPDDKPENYGFWLND
jgi:hypothetical protein